MSFAALAWAAKQRPGNLAAKMVLLGLANFADEHGCAYPSTAALAEFGDMDPKTATAALDKLVALNLIVDSGDREGRTKQIKVYRLDLESLPQTEAYRKRKPTVSPPKGPQKRGTDTVREPAPKKDKPSLVREKVELPDDWKPEDFGIETQSRKVVDGWPPGEAARQLEHFRAHHRKKGDRFRSWQDAWATWVLNARAFGGHNGRSDTLGRNQSADGLSSTARAAIAVFGSDPGDGRGVPQ